MEYTGINNDTTIKRKKIDKIRIYTICDTTKCILSLGKFRHYA